jgi:predicted NBD/HSP70 family sugar kinase
LKSPTINDSTSSILRELCLDQGISAARLSQKTGLDTPAVNSVLHALQQRELLKPSRRRVLLRDDLGFIVAVDMGGSNIRYVAVNMNGETLKTQHAPINANAGPDATIEMLARTIARLSARQIPPRKLLAISIGVPSAVHPKTGVLVNANNLPGWINVSMRERLAKRFQVPVVLDNDCNMAAVGEQWRGCARDSQTFIFVSVGTGIGTGICIDRKILQGRSGSAGEIYLMNADWSLWNEAFPETGHLESYTSGYGMAWRARQDGILKTKRASTNVDRDVRMVFAAMAAGNPKAKALVQDVFTVLGVGIANMISVLDPDLIVLNGGLTKGHPQLMMRTIQKIVKRIYSDPPKICWSSLGEKAQIFGATWAGLELAYSHLLQQEV